VGDRETITVVEADEFDRSICIKYCLHHVNGCGPFRYLWYSDAIKESFVEFANKVKDKSRL
jgi:UDP-N-acetylmuramate--alanine ligase